MLITHDKRAKNKDIGIILHKNKKSYMTLFLNRLIVEKIIANRKYKTRMIRHGLFMWSGTMPSLKSMSLMRESLPSNISKIEPMIIKADG